MEFSLNETRIHWIQGIQEFDKMLSVRMNLGWQFKDCGILVSYTRGGWLAGSSPFTVMTNIFVIEFSEFSKNI